jgi:hypothetical protein
MENGRHDMNLINWRGNSLLFVLLLLISGGAALLLLGPRLIGHSAEGFGEALLVAGLLGLTVDGYLKEHLLKEAMQDVASFLIGYPVPKEIQGTIHDLMRTRRVSRDLHLHYKLTPIAETLDKILVEIRLTYNVENITNKRESYRQYIYQHSSSSPRFLELRCDSNDQKETYYLGSEGLEKQVKAQEGEILSRVFGPPINLQPHAHPGGFQYHLTANYTIVCPQDYSDLFIFDYPCIRVIVTAEYPHDFEFHGPKEEPDNVNRWDCSRIFLSGEQITVHWRKKPKVLAVP